MTKIILTSLLLLVLFQSCKKDSEVIEQPPVLERLIPYCYSDTIKIAFRPEVNNNTGTWNIHVTFSKAINDHVTISFEWASNNQVYGIQTIYAPGTDNTFTVTGFPVTNPIYSNARIIIVTCSNPQYHFVF